MRKIKTNDVVIVISGDDKNKVGRVLNVLDDGKFYVVEGVNQKTKHIKPDYATKEPGRREKITKPIRRSKIAIYNPESSKRDKVEIQTQDGKKVRVFKSNKKPVAFSDSNFSKM